MLRRFRRHTRRAWISAPADASELRRFDLPIPRYRVVDASFLARFQPPLHSSVGKIEPVALQDSLFSPLGGKNQYDARALR